MPVLTALASIFLLSQGQLPTVQDEVIGRGSEAALGDVVSLGLKVTYLNGQIFDSTFGAAPFAIKLGWRFRFEGFVRLPFMALDEKIVGMKAGGKRKITLPPELAFGNLEVGDLPKGSPLTFEVELYEVQKKGSQASVKIEEIIEGEGEPLQTGKSVVVSYKGTFLNGTQFDSSHKVNPDTKEEFDVPLEFKYVPKAMTDGFLEGLKGMKAGGKRRVTVPYQLGYGESGFRGIPPYSTLVFELELKSIY